MLDVRLLRYWDEYANYRRCMITKEQIENSFTYHKPEGTQQDRYVLLRDHAKQLAIDIVTYTPSSREQSLAITKLEEAIMWANKAIACNE